LANIKISAAADAGTLLSSDMIPLARSGNTNAYHATMTEIANFTNASIASGAYGNIGRNVLHNPLFNVAQRGIGAFGGGTYSADRWLLGATGASTLSTTVAGLVDSDRSSIGDEAAKYCLSNVFVGGAGATDFVQVSQCIEDVRRLAGKTVTISFWATGSTGNMHVGVNLYQSFGTGGSPSASVNTNGQLVALAASAGVWTRVSATIAVPSSAGKTLGTNGDHFTQCILWLSAGSTYATISGGVGVRSGTINIWGIQLEIGSVATPLEKPDPRYDLSNCQRFYYASGYVVFGVSNQLAGAPVQFSTALPVQMRVVPTMTVLSNSNVNVSSFTLNGLVGASSVYANSVATASGTTQLNFSFSASADF
jgi:hypothetical protein